MRRPFRFALVVLGLAAAVYGTASLTGGWLGTPPWWEQTDKEKWDFAVEAWEAGGEIRERWCSPGISWCNFALEAAREEVDRSEARGIQCDGVTGGVAVAGLGFLAVAVRPRRRRPAPAP